MAPSDTMKAFLFITRSLSIDHEKPVEPIRASLCIRDHCLSARGERAADAFANALFHLAGDREIDGASHGDTGMAGNSAT